MTSLVPSTLRDALLALLQGQGLFPLELDAAFNSFKPSSTR